MIERMMSASRLRFPWPRRPEGRTAPVVPRASIAGKALTMIIAIMTLLAGLSVGAVDLISSATAGWQAQIVQQVTIQIRPADGRDMDAEVKKALDIVQNTAGVSSARALSQKNIADLLEPWLGKNVDLSDLPTPRLIVVELNDGAHPDLKALSASLEKAVPGATLDDHRVWLDRLRMTGSTLVGIGLGILALVVTATGLSVFFATRSAVAGNRDVVEVLHFVGARDGFVAAAFARRFMRFGLRGGAIGGGLAALFFLCLGWFGPSAGDAGGTLIRGVTLGPGGYLGIAVLVVLIAALTAATSRITVFAHLRKLG